MRLFFISLALCALCSVATAQEREPQAVIFETDMGNDIDDAMALDLLFKNMDQGNINLLAVSDIKNSLIVLGFEFSFYLFKNTKK